MVYFLLPTHFHLSCLQSLDDVVMALRLVITTTTVDPSRGDPPEPAESLDSVQFRFLFFSGSDSVSLSCPSRRSPPATSRRRRTRDKLVRKGGPFKDPRGDSSYFFLPIFMETEHRLTPTRTPTTHPVFHFSAKKTSSPSLGIDSLHRSGVSRRTPKEGVSREVLESFRRVTTGTCEQTLKCIQSQERYLSVDP